MSYEKELSIALNAVQTASYLCRETQMSLVTAETVEKEDRSPVTIADFGSQAVVNALILRSFPNDIIVGEEDTKTLRENKDLCKKVLNLVSGHLSGLSETEMLDAIDSGTQAEGGNRFWTVDPIDGTKGFLRGDQYAIALALIEKGEAVMGILGCPNFSPDGKNSGGSLFFAVKGMGTRVQNLDSSMGKTVFVNPAGNTAEARFCESVESAHAAHDVHAEICEDLGITAPPYRIDSQAKYAAVASGKADIYIRLPRSANYREKIWDHAAGVVIVEEAGGKVTDFRGRPLDFTKGRILADNIGILAASGSLHNAMLSSIKANVRL